MFNASQVLGCPRDLGVTGCQHPRTDISPCSLLSVSWQVISLPLARHRFQEDFLVSLHLYLLFSNLPPTIKGLKQ